MKHRNIYKGSWWFNNRRKHPSYIIKSNNKNYFETRLLSHKRVNKKDIELLFPPNPNDNKVNYLLDRTYIEYDKKVFGTKLKFKLSNIDKKRMKKRM